jgi:hypothetical protein
MANLYPFIDNGTWESYSSGDEVVAQGSSVVCKTTRSSDFAHSGSFSGKGRFVADPINPSFWHAPKFYFPIVRYGTGPRPILGLNFSPETIAGHIPNKQFKFKVWVYIPSSNPIASNDAHVYIGPGIQGGGGLNGIGPIVTPTIISRTIKTVADCLDQWVEFEYEIIGTQPNGFLQVNSFTYVSIYILDSSIGPGDVPSIPGHIFEGTINPGGVLYMDDISLEEILVCDLTPGTPSYNKTNEVTAGAHDGTITAHYTSSNTIEYSLDNATWQLSNVFTGLAPSTYTLYVRDSGGCTDSVTGIEILAGAPDPDPPTPVPGPLTVDQKPLNNYNFINWFSAFGPTNYTEIQTENCCFDLPKGYDRQNKTNRIHTPIVSPLEEFAFYINFDQPLTDPDFSFYRLGLFNVQGLVMADIAPLQKHDITTGVYNIYASVELPGGIDFGVYYLMIYRQDTNAIIMVSNPIELMSLQQAKCDSVRLQHKHGYNIYNYYYELVPFYINKIRLKLYRIDNQADGNLTQYRAVSTGRLRNVSFELDKFIVFEAYYFDDLAHDGMMVWQAHGFITINDKFFLPKSLFKIAFDARKKVMKGTIEMYEQAFSTANRYAPLTDITIVGSDDPLLLGDGGGRIKL